MGLRGLIWALGWFEQGMLTLNFIEKKCFVYRFEGVRTLTMVIVEHFERIILFISLLKEFELFVS